ncbi:MAG: hypothetical protein IPQ02_19405 [Saprospiraceae bacterium]|uniref:Uncharacterized protein n=1 Tax=Candidatus Defluviibacterium haderslevense TaxID=2981993 RepID=A0A9D7S5Q8_9BACT|nr:hypothetical protein [Candidatus Defluviibacterium haderslevense]MBL0238698.1 hypothetical protein [Candidatus Defluviibacterium haderslevense]
MRTYSFFLFFFIVLLIHACIKDESEGYTGNKLPYGGKTRTKIEGVVLEYGTRKPLANVMVFLDETHYAPFSGGGTFYPIDTTFTDTEGKFVYDFKHIPDEDHLFWDYQVRTEPYLYYPDYKSLESGYQYKNKELIVEPYAFIRAHIKNVNPFDDEDYIFVAFDGGSGGRFRGREINEFNIYRVSGNKKIEILTRLDRNKIETENIDSIYIKGHDTINYEIFY